MARLAFLGSPQVAAACLGRLVDEGHEVVLVVSGPDRRRGRGTLTSPTPVKALATSLGLVTSDRPEDLIGADAELGIVVAYGRLIKKPVLDALPLVNVHFSLLPRWRGAAPVERAILAGDKKTGVSLMALEEGLDTGPIYAQVETEIGPHEHADALTRRLGELGSELLVEQLAKGPSRFATATPQQGEVTYAQKITDADLELHFEQRAELLEARVRIGPGVTSFRGRRLLVHEAIAEDSESGRLPGELAGALVTTGKGALRLIEVQLEGRVRQEFSSFARGARLRAGERLGS